MASAQYQFDDKKAEKLYNKLDKAYFDYDYATILDNEDAINQYFVPKNDTLTARVFTFLGESYEYEMGDLEKALDFYTKELAIRRKLTPDQSSGDLVFNIASLSFELGRTKEAEDLYLELVKLDLEKYGEDDPKYWDSEISLLDFYSFSQQPNKGLEVSKRLRKTFDKNSVENAIRLKSEGDYNEMLGYYSKAERSYNRAVSIMQEQGLEASEEYIGVINALAILYMNTGKLPQAEELFVQAQDIADRLEDSEDIKGGLTSNMAQVYFELGNYDQAEKTYVQLLADDLEYFGEESANYGITAYNLALNQLYAGNYSDARKYHQLAQEVFEVAMEEDDPYNAYILNNMILLNVNVGDPDRAMEFGEKAIQKYKKVFGEEHVQTSFPYFNIGNAYMALDDQDKATEYHEKALEIREKTVGKSHPLYAVSTRQLAILEWKKGNNEKALEYFQETFDNYYQQINNYFPILNEEQKTKFYYNKLRPTVEQFSAFVVKAAPDDRSLQGKMYNYQLTLKGIILSATNKVKQSILTSGDSVLIDKYETWLGQKENLAQLFSDSEMEESKRAKKIDSLSTSSAALEKELSKLSAGFASTIEDKQPTWQDIQAKLKPGEAAVEMVRFRDFATDSAGVFTDEVFYAALIVRHDTEDFPEMVLIRNGQQMETRFLANYRNAIKYKISESRSFNLYWRPISNRLEGIRKIYYSPDGVYNQISINTLQNSVTKEFNLDEIEIWQMTNTKDLLSMKSTGESTGKSVFFGYPNYNLGSVDEEMKKEGKTDATAERGGRGGTKGKELDLTSVSIPRGLRGNMLRYMRSNSLLVLLPGTKKEVELIDSLYEKASIEREVFMSNEAIEEEIKALDNPKALHIATHGFFLENSEDHGGKSDGYVENPLLRSGLILAGANSFIRSGQISENLDLDDDGILTAYEAMNLPLDNTEIVVLSACETGLGEVKNGEGVFGLQRAFRVAGADAIIMSMWTVDDAATQELMTIFYEDWLKTGDKHMAFISAQRRLKEKYKAPYYWGAFVLVGN